MLGKYLPNTETDRPGQPPRPASEDDRVPTVQNTKCCTGLSYVNKQLG